MTLNKGSPRTNDSSKVTPSKDDRPSLEEEYSEVVKALEDLETEMRILHMPSMKQRAPPLEVDDLKEGLFPNNAVLPTTEQQPQQTQIQPQPIDEIEEGALLGDMANIQISKEEIQACLKRRHLRTFAISQIPTHISFSQITHLNVSQNELMDLPGLSRFTNLTFLNLERNWFNTLPLEIGALTELQTLNAARNFLRPNTSSLQLDQLQQLSKLKHLNLTYNQKCGQAHHLERIQKELPNVTNIEMTLWEEIGNVPGTFVGACAADRDPILLRSQLEPLKTVSLRRRLVQDFGQLPTDPAEVDRAQVMARLLDCYQKEGMMTSDGMAQRKQVRLEGVTVPEDLIQQLLVELRQWTTETGTNNKNRERPSIQAGNYMILRSPKLDEKEESSTQAPSRRAKRMAKKLERYKRIWDLAMQALKGVDPVFAQQCTEVAVTYKFRGSPHIDKQNCGPFYGLSMGEFSNADGRGGICVECSARVVAVMNTKNRLGRVDGRYPHWVAPYCGNDNGTCDQAAERYSLIYYETGNAFVKPGPAVFSIPTL